MRKAIMMLKLPDSVNEAVMVFGEKHVLSMFYKGHTITIQAKVRQMVSESRCPYGCNDGKRYGRLGQHMKRHKAG